MLTEDQKAFYAENGYLMVEDVLRPEELKRLQDITYGLIDGSREVITADDIRRIRISGDPALEPLPASVYDEIVGQRAASCSNAVSSEASSVTSTSTMKSLPTEAASGSSRLPKASP